MCIITISGTSWHFILVRPSCMWRGHSSITFSDCLGLLRLTVLKASNERRINDFFKVKCKRENFHFSISLEDRVFLFSTPLQHKD